MPLSMTLKTRLKAHLPPKILFLFLHSSTQLRSQNFTTEYFFLYTTFYLNYIRAQIENQKLGFITTYIRTSYASLKFHVYRVVQRPNNSIRRWCNLYSHSYNYVLTSKYDKKDYLASGRY